MALKDLRAYQLSLTFYHACENFKCPQHLRDQLMRASSSITLNLSEGSAKPTRKARANFYFIALGSLRECQAILDLCRVPKEKDISAQADQLGGHIFKLAKSEERR